MLNIFYTSIFIAILTNILMILSLILSKKSFNQREKITTFECGFDQKSSSRMPFSLRFFLIAIIFLIFDVEIALILPSISNINMNFSVSWLILNISFILILIIGLIHEWYQGALEWSE